MEPTEITAGRLHLRPWQAYDADALGGALDDDEVRRWTALTPRGVPAMLATSAARWAEGTQAELAVLDATTGSLLAGVDLHGIEAGDAAVGWWTAAGARGDGVATEAVQVLCRWAFGAAGLHRLTAHVEVGNWAARAVAEKAGFTGEGVLRDVAAPSGRRAATWLASLLATDEVRDRRALPTYGEPSDGVVTLRRWRSSDGPAVARACADPQTARWLPVPVPYTAADGTAYVDAIVPSEWAAGRVANAAVTDASTGELLGAIALSLRSGIGEVGYWTAPWARGRGVAVRATRLHTAWGFDVLRLPRVELLTDVRNTASQRVAEKAGFVREGVARALRGAPRSTERVDMVVWSYVPGDLGRR